MFVFQFVAASLPHAIGECHSPGRGCILLPLSARLDPATCSVVCVPTPRYRFQAMEKVSLFDSPFHLKNGEVQLVCLLRSI